MIVILSSSSRGFLFWLVNYISLNGNSELEVLRIVKLCKEILINYPNALFGTKINKRFHVYWKFSLTMIQWNKITSFILSSGTLFPISVFTYIFISGSQQIRCFWYLEFNFRSCLYFKNYSIFNFIYISFYGRMID